MRERVERTIAGQPTDRPPVAVWRRFPGDDQRAPDFARSVIEFQLQYQWDVLLVLPAPHTFILDYNAQDEWRGALDGTRELTRSPIKRSLDWTDLRTLDPARGELAKYAMALGQICDTLPHTTPILAYVPSPLEQAAQLAGPALLRRHIRTQADRVRSALNTLTESTLRFVDAVRRLPLSGIAYVVCADFDLLSEDEYRAFGIPYDHKVLSALAGRYWCNWVHLAAATPMLRLCSDYPCQALLWRGDPDLVQGKLLFNGAVCGGVSAGDDLALGTPSTLRERVSAAVQRTNGRRLIVTPDAAAPLTTPLSNLRALRQAVEGMNA
jgi:uroporphyrinogen decarboxylase